MSIHLHTPPTARRRAPIGRNRPLEEAEIEKSQKSRRRKKGGKSVAISRELKAMVLYPGLVLGLGLLWYAANQYLANLPLEKIEISIIADRDNAFLTQSDVLEILGGENGHDYIGDPMESLPLLDMEQRLEAYPSIAQAEVHKSMLGSLHLQVVMREAVGRLINNSGSHLYLDAEGNKFPISRRHSAYVPLVRGDFEESVVDSFACSTIGDALPLLNYIHNHPFWKAQIAELVIFQDGQVELLPTVSDLDIDFGYPVHIEDNFDKLMDFYRQVPPETGWKKYRKLSLKIRGQVVATKR